MAAVLNTGSAKSSATISVSVLVCSAVMESAAPSVSSTASGIHAGGLENASARGPAGMSTSAPACTATGHTERAGISGRRTSLSFTNGVEKALSKRIATPRPDES